MLAEPLMALAGAGATALVGAMATDVWQGARGGVVRLLGRSSQERESQVAAQLDEDAVLVARADAEDADQIRNELLPVWRRRMAILLKEHPCSETELRELVERIRTGLPAEHRTWVQHNTARESSTLFAVQGGDIHYHQASPTTAAPPDGAAEPAP